MKVNSAIAALRGDRAPQRRAQDAMKRALDLWRATRGAEGALAEIERFGKGAPLESCPTLEAMFTRPDLAETMIDSLVGHFCRALRESPLGHPPFRHGFNGSASTLLLARSGRAQLMLQAREQGRYDYPAANFSDAVRFDAVLAGAATARIARIRGAEGKVHFAEEPIALKRGSRLAYDCNSESLLVELVERRLIVLRLAQLPPDPRPSREYCRASGDLLHRSAGSLASSRHEMMVALLGRMQRAEAAPLLSEIATGTADDSLRWQALRECLALDTAQGFAALCSLARDSSDSLAGEAGALRAQLVETYPQLGEWESVQCQE